MMDGEINDNGCYQQAQCGIDAMSPSNQLPCGLKFSTVLVCRCLSPIPLLRIYNRRLGMLCCGEFDKICSEEMAWYEEVEDRSKDEILAAVVMASYTYEYAVLLKSARALQKHRQSNHLVEILNHQSEIADNYISYQMIHIN